MASEDTTQDFMMPLQHAIAAHTNGGDGSDVFSIPKTVTQALVHDNAEFWKAAMLDKIVNDKEIFKVFGPPMPRTENMKVTPTSFYFRKR